MKKVLIWGPGILRNNAVMKGIQKRNVKNHSDHRML